jgi:hypothetical protein
MPDDKTLLFPCFDGNGMFFSMANVATTGKVGLLFKYFITPSRLRVQGDAKLTDEPATVGLWPRRVPWVRLGAGALLRVCAASPSAHIPAPWRVCIPAPPAAHNRLRRLRASAGRTRTNGRPVSGL